MSPNEPMSQRSIYRNLARSLRGQDSSGQWTVGSFGGSLAHSEALHVQARVQTTARRRAGVMGVDASRPSSPPLRARVQPTRDEI